jgi:hypothetical protein
MYEYKMEDESLVSAGFSKVLLFTSNVYVY